MTDSYISNSPVHDYLINSIGTIAHDLLHHGNFNRITNITPEQLNINREFILKAYTELSHENFSLLMHLLQLIQNEQIGTYFEQEQKWGSLTRPGKPKQILVLNDYDKLNSEISYVGQKYSSAKSNEDIDTWIKKTLKKH